jgi:hypothetical protein
MSRDCFHRLETLASLPSKVQTQRVLCPNAFRSNYLYHSVTLTRMIPQRSVQPPLRHVFTSLPTLKLADIKLQVCQSCLLRLFYLQHFLREFPRLLHSLLFLTVIEKRFNPPGFFTRARLESSVA